MSSAAQCDDDVNRDTPPFISGSGSASRRSADNQCTRTSGFVTEQPNAVADCRYLGGCLRISRSGSVFKAVS